MGDYRLKIGTEEFLKEIQNTEDWGQTIVRDFNDRIYRVRGDYRFKGWQGLYSLLYTNMVANGICNSLTGSIYFRGDAAEDFEKVWRGDIKPQDFEFDLINYSADGQILDASWSARIKDASEQEVSLRIGIDRQGRQVPKCPFVDAYMFDPTNPTLNAYLSDQYRCYSVYDVFAYLIRYHCGDSVTFASDYFGSGGDGEQVYLTSGKVLRTANKQVDVLVSFRDLFDELNKKYNLWLIVEGTYDNPVIRVEPQSYVFDDGQAYVVNNQESVVVRTVLDRLYTKVSVGGDVTEYDLGNDADYPNRPFDDWNNETYNTTGQCGFENRELDLVSRWRIDTNSIQTALNATDTTMDEDIFLIEIDANGYAIKYTNAVTAGGDVDYFYNFGLTNPEVLVRWFGQLPEVASGGYAITGIDPDVFTLDAGNGRFIEWDNTQQEDPYNIFVTTAEAAWAGYFIAPVSGYYVFDISIRLEPLQVISSAPAFFDGHLYLDIYENPDTFANPLERIEIERFDDLLATEQVVRTLARNMESGQVAILYLKNNGGRVGLLDSGHFAISGGNIKYDFGDAFDYRFEYDIQQFALPVSGFDDIKASRGFVRFVDDATGRAWDVWPSEMSYSHERQVVTTGKFVGRSPLNINTDLCWALDGEYGLGYWDSSCYWINSKTWVNPKF